MTEENVQLYLLANSLVRGSLSSIREGRGGRVMTIRGGTQSEAVYAFSVTVDGGVSSRCLAPNQEPVCL